MSAPWEPGTIPTPEQLRDFFLRQSPELQLEFMQWSITEAQEARDCFAMNHKGLQSELDHLQTALSERTELLGRTGWMMQTAIEEKIESDRTRVEVAGIVRALAKIGAACSDDGLATSCAVCGVGANSHDLGCPVGDAQAWVKANPL